MAKINPQDEKYDGQEKTPHCGPGRKKVAAVGFERYSSSKGSPMLGVRFVCLLDYEGEGDETHVVFENFALTDNAMWRLISFARAIGWQEPFDPDDDEDIGKLLLHGYVDVKLANEKYQGKNHVKVARFEACQNSDTDPGWPALIEHAEDQFRQYIEWRAQNPRGQGGGGNRGGGGRRSSGGGGRSSQQDDMPF